MKVYIVVYLFKTWREIGGVYESREKAQEEVDNFKLTHSIGCLSGDISIIEREINFDLQ